MVRWRAAAVAVLVVVAAAVGLPALWPGTAPRAVIRAPASPAVLRLPAPGTGGRGCEAGLARARLVIVGASFTAGAGSGRGRSWAVLLARHPRWDAIVYGTPGAGYVRPGAGRRGPVAAEIGRVDLRMLKPSLVVVQAGHDDIGVPPRVEQQRVEQAIALIRTDAPRAPDRAHHGLRRAVAPGGGLPDGPGGRGGGPGRTATCFWPAARMT